VNVFLHLWQIVHSYSENKGAVAYLRAGLAHNINVFQFSLFQFFVHISSFTLFRPTIRYEMLF